MKKAVFAVLILILTVLLATFATLDFLVARAVERGIHDVTGLPTQVGGASVAVVRGELTLERLEIANPEGYESPYLFRLERLDITVPPRALLKPVVHIPRLTIGKARLYLERQGTATNFNTVLTHVRTRIGQEAPPAKTEGMSRRFVIDELRISGISAQAILARSLGKRGQTELAIPPVVLHDVGTQNGGITLSQLAALVAGEVLAQVQHSGDLPPELQRGLNSALEARQKAQDEIERQRQRLLEQGRQLLEGR